MPAPLIPWSPSNIPTEIQEELNRRKTNRSFDFKSNASGWNQNGDWDKYKGPMTSWVRMCSNGTGHPATPKPRFVLHSGKGFYDGYGFSPPSGNTPGNSQIIGYTPNGVPHTIENSLTRPGDEPTNYPIHVPPPEISKIDCTMQSTVFRQATVEWVCFSWKQLVYMTPYFLVPRITVLLEWGWNHFDPMSLVDLTDISGPKGMKELWKNSYPLYEDNILGSKGNYDVIYGIISNWKWSVEGSRIICSTEIMSKDRLYTGLAKNNTISVDTEVKDKPGLITNFKDFLTDSNIIANIKQIAVAEKADFKNLVVKMGPTSRTGSNDDNNIFKNIITSVLNQGTIEEQNLRESYLRGVFSGRSSIIKTPSPGSNKGNVAGSVAPPLDFNFSSVNNNKAAQYDFDYSIQQNDADTYFWINMGLVVEFLNQFTALPGGDKNIFYVDILNSVIGGHRNLISCDPNILIPNYAAPKYHWGSIGTQNKEDKDSYKVQKLTPQNADNPPDITLKRVCMHHVFGTHPKTNSTSCYRNNLDFGVMKTGGGINDIRYKHCKNRGNDNFNVPGMWSFPSGVDVDLPVSHTKITSGKVKVKVEKDISGLLSNIYVNLKTLRDIVSDDTVVSYPDIYTALLKRLNDASDGFWDLVLVESEQNMTITDRKYLSKAMKQPTDKAYSFDYYDADSIIKSLKFTPALTTAQATRALYGKTNNSGSKFSYVDKNDLLDYKFKDDVNFGEDVGSDVSKKPIQSWIDQYETMLQSVQYINQPPPGQTGNPLQMTFPAVGNPNDQEYVKLVIAGTYSQELLRLLLDDGDFENNPRYCAIQPGITLELTIQGIGGLRVFQYFLIKNLPAPYSDKDVIFRITNINTSLERGNWETVITAGILPLRKYIRDRINPPDGGWPSDAR